MQENYPRSFVEGGIVCTENTHTQYVHTHTHQADALLGSPMTYSLIQHAQDNASDLVTRVPTHQTVVLVKCGVCALLLMEVCRRERGRERGWR